VGIALGTIEPHAFFAEACGVGVGCGDDAKRNVLFSAAGATD